MTGGRLDFCHWPVKVYHEDSCWICPRCFSRHVDFPYMPGFHCLCGYCWRKEVNAPTIEMQLAVVRDAASFAEGVRRMNALVLQKCPPRRRIWWLLGWRPAQHQYEDMTSMLNTVTYTTLDRCKCCGWFKLGSGL